MQSNNLLLEKVTRESSIQYNFMCPLTSYKYQLYKPSQLDEQSLQTYSIIYTKSKFDYICQIVSDDAGFYIELQNCATNIITCYQRRFHRSNINRTTLLGILCALWHIAPNSSIKFMLQNLEVAVYLKQYSCKSADQMQQIKNQDIMSKIVQYQDIQFCFRAQSQFEDIFYIRLKINKSSTKQKFYDLGSGIQINSIDVSKFDWVENNVFNKSNEQIDDNSTSLEHNQKIEENITVKLKTSKTSKSSKQKPNYDYICQIVSNDLKYYLELQKTGNQQTECFHGQHDLPDANRTTFHGIIRVLEQIEPKSSILFILLNKQVGSQIIRFQQTMKTQTNQDLQEEIYNKYEGVLMYFQHTLDFDERFFQTLNQNVSSGNTDEASLEPVSEPAHIYLSNAMLNTLTVNQETLQTSHQIHTDCADFNLSHSFNKENSEHCPQEDKVDNVQPRNEHNNSLVDAKCNSLDKLQDQSVVIIESGYFLSLKDNENSEHTTHIISGVGDAQNNLIQSNLNSTNHSINRDYSEYQQNNQNTNQSNQTQKMNNSQLLTSFENANLSFNNSNNNSESSEDPIITKVFQFRKLTVFQAEQFCKVLLEMDLPFQMRKKTE
ncbi:Conserved_hypothetical protein [Hexamita inflata]|uniref:Uncharacterized protein n=1 Tax=Hexamita inflata TaxID=28002 RepID=A0AA86RY77_9EUKA|nr:Conserved hypothetical protein [Hexamita inflata]